MKINNILSYLEQRFPYELAADFDLNKIGLSIGDGNAEVTGILCALDVTNEVIDEAIKNNCNLIISHHPITFYPLTKILLNDEKGSLIIKLIKNDINVIAMHTNMDLGKDGVADTLCKMFGMKESNYGVSVKGDYIRYGKIDEISLLELTKKTKQLLQLDGVKVVGDLNKKISKIGILGGSGGHESDIMNTVEFGCQCYITGEIKHHIGLMAKFYDLCLIEVYHGVEKFVFDQLAIDLKEKFNVNVLISEYDFNVFKFV